MKEAVFSFIPKPDSVSWDELVFLWKEAYRERAEEGLLYGAVTQDKETLVRRASAGTCFCAFVDGKLAGTVCMQEFKTRGVRGGYVSLVAVSPKMKRKGIGSKMLQEISCVAFERGYRELRLHTAEGARTLVRWYLKEGFQKIGLDQFAGTNCYDILFRKPIGGRRYNPIFAGALFFLRALKTRLLVSESGSPRFLKRILRPAKRILFR